MILGSDKLCPIKKQRLAKDNSNVHVHNAQLNDLQV
jgi:hypothetical protein